MRFIVFWYKWWARLVGGHAVWVKHEYSGRLHLKIARHTWDPFDDQQRPHLHVTYRGDSRLLDMSTGRFKCDPNWKW
jgi:hypothetical protein